MKFIPNHLFIHSRHYYGYRLYSRQYFTWIRAAARAGKFTVFTTTTTAGILGMLSFGMWINEWSEWASNRISWAKQTISAIDSFIDKRIKHTYSTISQILDEVIHNNSVQTLPIVPFQDKSTSSRDFHPLIKRMLEIQKLLNESGYGETFKLPSIVVIGSQSSGKSSVLESFVGHEFLPKGTNMITRRPLLLSLVHSPDTVNDYAMINEHGSSTPLVLTDFSQVRDLLTQWNAQVPESEGILDVPIELSIFSRNLPDLNLIDLPGYIQIPNKDQPHHLRECIQQLCNKYIQYPNIILAISSADVDLANSESLKASKNMDPDGTRTIGVLTKLDLVDASYAASLLNNQNYPLPLGYVGVVCKKPPSSNSSWTGRYLVDDEFGDTSIKSSQDSYFYQYPTIFYSDSKISEMVGMSNLRKKLSNTLEHKLIAQIDTLNQRISSELDDLNYQWKVQHSDQYITPSGYLSSLYTKLNEHINQWMKNEWTRSKIMKLILNQLEPKLLNIYESLRDKTCDKIDLQKATLELTKCQIGKTITHPIVAVLEKSFQDILKQEPFSYHQSWRNQWYQMIQRQLHERQQQIITQVENAMKPIKHGIGFTASEWNHSKQLAIKLIQKHLESIRTLQENIQKEIGVKRLRQFLQEEKDNNPNRSYWYHKAKEMERLEEEAKKLNIQLNKIKNSDPLSTTINNSSWWYSTSKSTENSSLIIYDYDATFDKEPMFTEHPCMVQCPEIYLELLTQKIANMTYMFLKDELSLNRLSHSFDASKDPQTVGSANWTADSIAQENPAIAAQLSLQQRRISLMLILEKLYAIRVSS